MKKYTNTSAPLSSEREALLKIEELVGKINALLAKLDADGGVANTDYIASIGETEKPSAEIIKFPEA